MNFLGILITVVYKAKIKSSRSPASESLGEKSLDKQSLQPLKFYNMSELININSNSGKKLIDLDGDGKFEVITYEKKPGTMVLEMDLANTGKPNYFHEYDTDGISLRSSTWSIDSKTNSRIYDQNCIKDTCETKSLPDIKGEFTHIESKTKVYNKNTGLVTVSTELRKWNEVKKQFDVSKSKNEVSAVQYFVDAEKVDWDLSPKPGPKDNLSWYKKIFYSNKTTQAAAICLECYNGDLNLNEVEKLLKQSIAPVNENIILKNLPSKVFNGSKFYYLNGIYVDEYSCKGLTGKELQLINNDIYEKMSCMLRGAKQLEQTGPAENAIVMKEHLRRLLMTLALKDKKQQPLLGKIKKEPKLCEDPDYECIEYKEMDGPSFTCYTAINGQFDMKTHSYVSPCVMYATSSISDAIIYKEKKDTKIGRIFSHPHINYNHADKTAGTQSWYGKNKVIDFNLPVFHELIHTCGYDHDENQCEYAYPCGQLCGRDMVPDPDFLKLCSHSPEKRQDPNYLGKIKEYFGENLRLNGTQVINSSNGARK